MAVFTGSAGDDTFVGTFSYDYFDLGQGGDDRARGGSASDTFSMAGALTSGDRLDGGAGDDAVYLQGDYSAGLAVTAASVVGVEYFYINAGFDYDLTFADAVNSTASGMVINASFLGGADHLYFNGSRETSSPFQFYDGAGDDRLVGGHGSDGFNLISGGGDIATGGDGNDVFSLGGQLDRADRINGGDGHDYLYLIGDYGLTFRPNTLRFVEQIYLTDGYDYRLRLHDNTVAAGEVLTVDASGLTGDHTAMIDDSNDLDGRLVVTGGAWRDILIGGAGDDRLWGADGRDSLVGGDGDDWLFGGEGHDDMRGGAGQDTFYFQEGQSVGNPDLMADLALSDVVDLLEIDADATLGGNQAFTLVNHFTRAPGQLDLVYDSAAGVTHFLMDTDGDGAADQAIDAAGNRTAFTQFVL
jgi:Ca2+-binding RTX toxin-like protein